MKIFNRLKLEWESFRLFTRDFSRYAHKRLLKYWVWFDKQKDMLVALLVAKRGMYARPFMHTSLFILIAIAIVAAPIIKQSYETQANELSDIQPPSAILTSIEADETSTLISDKPRDQVIKYTVEDGDTLSRISKKYDVSIDTLKWANPDLKGESIKPGAELNIPPVTGVVIKVRKGDTIYSLAKKYNVDPQNIVNFPFNDFTDLDTFALAVGQNLVVPGGEIAAPAAPVTPRIPTGNIAFGTAPAASGQFLWPTNGVITQRPVSYHMAFDIANNALPAVMAADSGVVTIPAYDKYGYGNHIFINHGNGYITNYAHLSQILVSNGQAVTKGQVIGRMGSTGRSTGPHLHFEIRKGGTLLNPAQFFK